MTESGPGAGGEPAAKVACIGECMIELLDLGDGTMLQSFGGDAFNTAAYLARQAGPAIDVQFVSLTGDDVYSAAMRALWRMHGVGDAYAPAVPGGRPGLYIIRRDAAGERTFHHYRSESAARQLFGPGQPAWIDEAVAGCDLVYLSAITLSIITEPARARLAGVLERARSHGGLVAFDGNFRASGWPCVPAARAAIEGVLQHVDIALPTLADEAQVFGDENAEACVRRMRDAGVGEIAVKLGADGSLIADRSQAQHVPAVPGVAVIDTTAAGDAFNGAYLATRLSGAGPREAAEAGNVLAAEVITHPGALLPPDRLPLRESE